MMRRGSGRRKAAGVPAQTESEPGGLEGSKILEGFNAR